MPSYGTPVADNEPVFDHPEEYPRMLSLRDLREVVAEPVRLYLGYGIARGPRPRCVSREYWERPRPLIGLTEPDIRLLRAYFRIWIHCRYWDSVPQFDDADRRAIRNLRRDVNFIRNADDVRRWVWDADRTGINPLA